MKLKIGIFICCAFCLCQITEKQYASITGTVAGFDEAADSTLRMSIRYNYNEAQRVNIDQGNTFEINTDSLGPYHLIIDGGNQHSEKIILVDQFENVDVTIKSAASSSKDWSVVFSDTNQMAAKYHRIKEWYSEIEKKEHKVEIVDKIFQRMEAGNDQEMKDLYGHLYLKEYFRRTESERIRQMLEVVSPSSIVWEMGAQRLGFLQFMLPEEDHEYLASYIKRVSEENTYPTVRAEAINYMLSLAELEGDSTGIRKYYHQLLSECPYSFRTRDARFKYEILAPGKAVPGFKVKSMGDSEEVYSNQSLLGNVYLLAFWNTTCGACKLEMPFLHEAHKKYEKYGFEILSLSMDDSPSDVMQFRKEEWEMPWIHVFLEGGFNNPVAGKFGVHGIPAGILVDKFGKIIKTGYSVRGAELLKILEAYFINNT